MRVVEEWPLQSCVFSFQLFLDHLHVPRSQFAKSAIASSSYIFWLRLLWLLRRLIPLFPSAPSAILLLIRRLTTSPRWCERAVPERPSSDEFCARLASRSYFFSKPPHLPPLGLLSHPQPHVSPLIPPQSCGGTCPTAWCHLSCAEEAFEAQARVAASNRREAIHNSIRRKRFDGTQSRTAVVCLYRRRGGANNLLALPGEGFKCINSVTGACNKFILASTVHPRLRRAKPGAPEQPPSVRLATRRLGPVSFAGGSLYLTTPSPASPPQGPLAATRGTISKEVREP